MTATQLITVLATIAAASAICGLLAALAMHGVVGGRRLFKFVFGPRRATLPYVTSAPSHETSVAILESVYFLTALVAAQGRQIDEMHTAFQSAQAQRARSS
jgi:hypothetical protein